MHLFLILFCLPFFVLATPAPMQKKEPVGYVVADNPLWGRLGNQLFVISTVLAYGWDYGFHPRFPCFDRTDNQLSYNRDRLFSRLDTRSFPYKIHKQYLYAPLAYKAIPRFKNDKNLSIQGLFVSWKYFHHHYQRLVSIFAPSDTILQYLYHKYGDLIADPSTVAIHVRTYSKKIHAACPFVGLHFFALALKEYPPEATFVIFSDRINWCKVHFPSCFPRRKFVFIEGNDHIEDLFLMSLMKHQIISNSTYSWWGAYLNQNPHKIITAPQQLFRRAADWPIQDFYLPEWRVIAYDFTQDPYPEDMEAYDTPTVDDTESYYERPT